MLTTVLSRLPGKFGRYSARSFYLRCILDLLYFYVESLLDRFLSVGVQMKIKLWRLAVLIFFGFGSFAQAQVGNPELIAQAKKEGALVWYTTISVLEAKEFADPFEKQFSPIKVEIFRSGAGVLANRISSEYQARNYRVDIVQGISSRGVIPAFKRKEIIGRYNSPEYKFVASDLKDKEGYWSAMTVNTIVLAYNTRMVKPADVPKTYDDLLKPMWKGKKILNDTENFAWFDELLKY